MAPRPVSELASVSTAWPPNSLRSAAIIFTCGESSWRAEKWAEERGDGIVGSGMAWSIAASTVQRPPFDHPPPFQRLDRAKYLDAAGHDHDDHGRDHGH